MTFPEFIGCTLIAFGPALAIFCIVVIKDPIRIIILISGYVLVIYHWPFFHGQKGELQYINYNIIIYHW